MSAVVAAPRRARWAIVGAGMLGMTIAHRLARSGEAVSVLEAAPHAGGLADAWQIGDVRWDRHYHVMLESDRHLLALLDELGLRESVVWARTRTGFFSDGHLYSLSNVREFLAFPPISLFDRLRLAMTILYASKIRDYRNLERVPVERWLTRLSGRRTYERLWKPLLRAKLGDGYQRASAAFIWAIIARMYAARRAGNKEERFGYVPGGYGRIVEAMEQCLHDDGVGIRLGCPVRRILRCDGGLRIELGDGTQEQYDRVIVTLAPAVCAALCTDLRERERELLRSIEYQGIVCASLLLDRPLGPYYVTNITDGSIPFTGVIEMSALVDRAHFGGRALVYLPKYVAPDDPIFERSDEAITAAFVAALEKMYANFTGEQVVASRISRVRHVLPVATLGYSDRVPPLETSIPGLFVVNSAQIVNGTLNVNETVELANRSAAELLARTGVAA